MPTAIEFPRHEIEQLRQRHYNAELLDFIRVHEDLCILRVHPDEGNPSFLPGQYCVLGLGNWESRLEGTQDEAASSRAGVRLLRRAYSFSCPMIDHDGSLLPPQRCPYLEFYMVLIRGGHNHPPALTPRMFQLAPGNRLFVGPKVTGHYTLDGIQPDDDCIFVATGTGEAPHNAMVAHLLSEGHQGRLIAVTCVRYAHDLAYLDAYRRLERHYPNVRYLTLTTREPCNIDAELPDYVGKRYAQSYFASGEFERDAQIELDATRVHVFLCGNPAMIGAPSVAGKHHHDGQPVPGGMIATLMQRGFTPAQGERPGTIHYEKYW